MNKTEGRALPQGAIVGAIPRFALDELSNFAGLLVGGCSKLGVSNLIFVVSPFSHIDDLCAADRPESLQWLSWCHASTPGFVQADIRARGVEQVLPSRWRWIVHQASTLQQRNNSRQIRSFCWGLGIWRKIKNGHWTSRYFAARTSGVAKPGSRSKRSRKASRFEPGPPYVIAQGCGRRLQPCHRPPKAGIWLKD